MIADCGDELGRMLMEGGKAANIYIEMHVNSCNKGCSPCPRTAWNCKRKDVTKNKYFFLWHSAENDPGSPTTFRPCLWGWYFLQGIWENRLERDTKRSPASTLSTARQYQSYSWHPSLKAATKGRLLPAHKTDPVAPPSQSTNMRSSSEVPTVQVSVHHLSSHCGDLIHMVHRVWRANLPTQR